MTGEFYEIFKEELITILSKLFQKIRGPNTPKLILQGQHYPDTKTQKSTPPEMPISMMNIDTNILNKIHANIEVHQFF